jgi:hypothetical protein
VIQTNSTKKGYIDYTGTWTLRNMFAPLLASIRAISWGVETIKAPVETNINEEIHICLTQAFCSYVGKCINTR